jgi:hypothetical protein
MASLALLCDTLCLGSGGLKIVGFLNRTCCCPNAGHVRLQIRRNTL